MNLDTFRTFCLNMKGTSEGFPFDEKTLAFKVGGKLFALLDIDEFTSVNLKCDPEKAIDLREQFLGVQPGYHMNKKHWNTVVLQSDVSDQLLLELVVHSYELVFNSLPKKIQHELQIR
ncbi:MAG: MmcQ/YjbR family DNA-binding protein [Crocinitomicaceae bacterium]|nr:MAG: MmcQ/YjbR family DNA-binding protein [Crocinitomicaceae bacterium]